MKKAVSILLILILLMTCASMASAEKKADAKTSIGTIRVHGEFTLKGDVPDGYKVIPVKMDADAIVARIVSDNPEKPEMILSIAYDEAYGDVERLNDLDDEDLEVLEKTFTATDPMANISYDETGYGTRLLVCRTTSDHYDYLDIFSIYKGYFVEFIMTPGKMSESQKLTEEEVAACNKFLTELDFENKGQELDLTKINPYVIITGYNKDNMTLDVTVMEQFTLPEEDVKELNIGQVIDINGTEVTIESLDEAGDEVIINEIYHLVRQDDSYAVFEYEMPVVKEADKGTVNVSENAVFVEGINPESGEPLDEEKILTVNELFTALDNAKEGKWIGFETLNTSMEYVSEDGKIPSWMESLEPDPNSDTDGQIIVTVVERFYAPWQ